MRWFPLASKTDIAYIVVPVHELCRRSWKITLRLHDTELLLVRKYENRGVHDNLHVTVLWIDDVAVV